MAPFRLRLGKVFQQLDLVAGPGGLAAGLKPENIGDIFFIIILIIIVGVSIALIKWAPIDAVQYILAAVWGMTIGGALLLYLPAKILITLIGGLLGVGASDLAGLAQVVEKMSTMVEAITKTINATGPVQFQQQAVWLFLILLALCCLPAYRTPAA